MKLAIPSNVTRALGRAGLTLKKYSPQILVVTGVVGAAASTVLACKATLKVNEVLDETKTNIDKIHTATEKGVTEAGEVYTAEDSQKDLTITYVQTGLKFVKLYGPAVALGALSATSIFAGTNMLHKRNVALAAAYTAVDKGFKEYRGRVIERFGKELDRELKYDIKSKEIEETVVNEDGTEQKVKKTVEVVGNRHFSPYAVCFDESCPNWTKSAEDNKFFILQTQDYLNKRLKTVGHVFLNEAYDALGFMRTKAGCEVGWVYDENHPVGDNCIDFNVFDLYDEAKRNFANGYEKSIWIDFNVDGPIKYILP